MDAEFKKKDKSLMHFLGVGLEHIIVAFGDTALRPAASVSPIIKSTLSRVNHLIHGANIK